MARQFTENLDEKVDIEEEMDFYDLAITGNYSYYDILEEEKKILPKMTTFGSKLKIRYEEGEYC